MESPRAASCLDAMNVTVTYFLEVISSWCYWAEPAWAELKQRYAGRPVQFGWKIALMDAAALPRSREQADWFYRRSGTIVRSPFMLNSGWFDAELKQYLAPNFVAEAGKDLGVMDDRVRLAIAEGAVREGRNVGQYEVAAGLGARAAGLDAKLLVNAARSPGVEKRVRAATAEFHALQVRQRPTFLLENNIGDRVVMSGLYKAAPLIAAIDALLDDAAAYAAHSAHFGPPPVD